MRASASGACLVVLAILAGCGGQGPAAPSPLSPSTPSGAASSVTQSLVAATVNLAAMNTAMTVSQNGSSQTITFPCADGGSISMTFTGATGAAPSGTLSSSSRMEFTDCRTQAVTINGDPAILMEGTYTFTGTGTTPSSMTSTSRMTGGLRFDAAGTPGRARYDCTMTMSMPIGGGGPAVQPAITSSGTITWEQPLGTVTLQPCGR